MCDPNLYISYYHFCRYAWYTVTSTRTPKPTKYIRIKRVHACDDHCGVMIVCFSLPALSNTLYLRNKNTNTRKSHTRADHTYTTIHIVPNVYARLASTCYSVISLKSHATLMKFAISIAIQKD